MYLAVHVGLVTVGDELHLGDGVDKLLLVPHNAHQQLDTTTRQL